jgi:hypothetical protein
MHRRGDRLLALGQRRKSRVPLGLLDDRGASDGHSEHYSRVSVRQTRATPG